MKVTNLQSSQPTNVCLVRTFHFTFEVCEHFRKRLRDDSRARRVVPDHHLVACAESDVVLNNLCKIFRCL